MSFKEFVEWCNERSCDGYWDMITSMTCASIIIKVKKISFWKRKKFWKDIYENRVLEEIVNPINKKIEDYTNKQ